MAAFCLRAATIRNAPNKLGKETSMANAIIDFNAPDLAARIEQASQSDLDNLPFGVIKLDREGTVLFYSATEARLSGYGMTPLGKNFFEVGRSPSIGDLRKRIMGAMESGPVDLEFGWTGDLADPQRDMRIRVQSSRQGGVWLFIERD
jgi:photoactive yellow protein